jgi:hypothetical protein
MELRVTIVPQRNPMTPPKTLPCPTRGHCPHYSVGPSRNTISTYGTLQTVTQTDTMHKGRSHPSEVRRHTKSKNALVSDPFITLTYMVT